MPEYPDSEAETRPWSADEVPAAGAVYDGRPVVPLPFGTGAHAARPNGRRTAGRAAARSAAALIIYECNSAEHATTEYPAIGEKRLLRLLMPLELGK
ncbi:hypothetical protein Ssi03_21730 [Sphaerisporangium siamense]|nr:hypothetical protein Ssi03_21730 [Sphaerisporangium siamense]